MGAGHSAEGDSGAYASDPPTRNRRKEKNRRRRHSVDSVASYSSQNHVDRIRTQNFSAASCQEDGDFGSIKTSLFRRSSSNLEFPIKRPDSVTSNTSSTRSRLRELVERKSCSEEHKAVADTVADIQYFENPTETLEFDNPRNSLDSRKGQDEPPKKRKQSKGKDKTKDYCENNNKKQEKYQSKLAEYYKLPVQLPQDEFYQHLTRSRAAEELLQKRFSNSDTEFSGSYGRLCKHKEVEGSNLRRSRSLAVIREETFTDLQLQNHSKNKRSQLIPRARLFEKPCFRDRLPGRAKYQTKEEVLESIYIDSTASCFGDINRSRVDDIQESIVEKTSDKEDAVSQNGSRTSQSICGSWPNLDEETKQTNISEDSIGHSRNPSEIDSLDSNYVRKHYNFEAHLKNYKDNSDAEFSVTSGNINREQCITSDGHNSETEGKEISKNNSPRQTLNNVSVSQSDKKETNQTFLKDDFSSYDEISVHNSKSILLESNELTIVKNTNTSKDEEFETQSVISENDGTISSPPDSITSYLSISIASSTDKSHNKLEHLANSLAEKIDEYCDSHFNENKSVNANKIIPENQVNSKTDPIYTKLQKRTFADVVTFKKKEDTLQINDVYFANTNIENSGYFKKTNCTSSKNITTEPYVTTVIENQYYSLPDINISKCLRKSERIDAQLREEDKEDISCENTYEITHNNFKDILSTKVSEQYGHLNKPNDSLPEIETKTNVLQYLEPPVINDFSKLDDDLKSIITTESSDVEELEETFYHSDCNHQNEREINEIEGTIRNNKIITKAESLRLSSSVLKPDIKILKSLSNDNINNILLANRQKTTLRKHYSLRQRDPTNDDYIRIPSPNSVEKSTQKSVEPKKVKDTLLKEIKNNSILSRVQSFKTTAESNITIVPLSGHQTIVIDPPVIQNHTESPHPNKTPHTHNKIESDALTQHLQKPLQKLNPITNSQLVEEKPKQLKNSSLGSIETSRLFTPRDPFITIKLNKIVKKTIPQLSKGTSNESILEQLNIDKPPSKLIIKDTINPCTVSPSFIKPDTAKMTRPQVIQVIDSKNKTNNSLDNKQPANSNNNCTKTMTNGKQEKREVIMDNKNEYTVKEKLNNAIKTDIEYQEKINSVKNYWSKLIEKPDECQKTQEAKENEENKTENDLITKTELTEPEKDDPKYVPEISVCSIIKSLESVKIVDSIRKIGQNKLQLWKDETEKVKSDSEIEETTLQKIVKDSKDTIYDKPKPPKNIKIEKDLCRDTPEIEIVELTSEDNLNQKTQATIIKAKGYEKGCDEFDHVRYKVMKSELFKNSMIANYRKEAQFDGLLQYLQDYSFQELLVNNNIVIIEPVRTKVEPLPRKNNNPDQCKIPSSLLKKTETSPGHIDKTKNAIKRHFFYHPIRVNKEIIEEELPNPDTVKKVRNLFEDTLKMKSPMNQDPPLVEETVRLTRRATSYKNLNEETKAGKIGGRKKVIRQLTIDTNFGNKKWDNASLSSGVSSGDLSSNNEFETDALSPYTNKNLKDNSYSSSDEYLYDSIGQDFCCESQYVSPDILKKIRDCGTSITYYGGKVLNSKTGSSVSPMTKAIMEEIKSLQKNCSRDCYSCQTKCRGEECSCLVADKHSEVLSNKQKCKTAEELTKPSEEKTKRDGFPGFKFKLVKSNSCSSRLELTGTDEIKNPRLKFRKQRSTEDPPLVDDEENSVKNKICRLESYNKGIVKTPFENKNIEDKITNIKERPTINKINEINTKHSKASNTQDNSRPLIVEKENLNTKREQQAAEDVKNLSQLEKQDVNDPHSFEKKFYYVNENIDQSQIKTGKFGEMVFEEFEVLETCYDSLNSNKSLK